MSASRIVMKVSVFVAGALLLGSATAPLSAQVASPTTNRLVVDSIVVEGAQRVLPSTILGTLGFEAGDTITLFDIQQAQKALWESSQFSDVQVFARGTGLPDDPATVEVRVTEAPLVRRVEIRGLQRASEDVVADSADLRGNQPFAPRKVAIAERAIRNELASNGIPFARIQTEEVVLAGRPNIIDLVIEVDEGERVSIAEYVIEGNERISDEEIVGALSQKPEGFWWFRSGVYDAERYETDIATSMPGLFFSRGFIDFQVISDTLIIDPNTGKARVEIQVDEGPQYRVAQLSIEGNTEFDDERLERFFLPETGGLLTSLGLAGGGDEAERGRVFDARTFEEVTGPGGEIQNLYAGAGFIFAEAVGTVEKLPPPEPGADPQVALTVQIEERSPAFIDEVLIVGNEFTHDRVIRERITVLPGDVYSQDRLIQSIQSIDGLGFFEPVTPGPNFVDVDPETGEVDVTFEVREKQTGTVNFGTSVGGGTGISGFVGYEQPNLFGQAKSGTVRWDFGRFVNSFTLSYTDPALFQSRTSGTVTLFNSRDRFFQFSSGRRKQTGGSVRFGFPAPGALRTRIFVGYGLSVTDFDLFDDADDASLFGRSAGTLSQMTFGIERTTLNNPIFPINGTRLSWNVEVNGGVLGGDGDFTKHIVESQFWTPVWNFGGQDGGAPNVISLGTKLRGGSILGTVDDFPFERFWMGGVQFGEKLRGYDETSITPQGFFPENSNEIPDIDRLGDAFMSISTELALRASSQFTLRSFFDAGNVWTSFDAVNPTDLFRGAGFGTTIITPFGPIGLDYAYGFDKPEPGWQFHFTFGQAGF
ncbi:MAG: outer membrane protein assembly factor BamA [Longimicrobiales bacterium]|nr:outer membrane protein assembly factor BamA [Longimicrobiales bacterium]